MKPLTIPCKTCGRWAPMNERQRAAYWRAYSRAWQRGKREGLVVLERRARGRRAGRKAARETR